MNMWFTKLIKQFFFWLDKIVFNFIPAIYDLLITIARTSVLTQADIADMADRVYKLLAIFMIFKVTLSLITYVVNPDDFSDKSKGVSKLGTNIIISLALLILTPYLFSYAYQIQTIILEDNSLATLIFGGEEGDKEKSDFFNSAGDEMAFTTISAFFSPNLSLENLHECSRLTVRNDKNEYVFNPACSGYNDQYEDGNVDGSLSYLMPNSEALRNYVAGVEFRNLGLMFREEMALATNSENTEFIMDYKFVFSTVVGVVVILLLISFCMDVAVRSLKLALLQLIAPVPIMSYVDPKSGKDGMFKKWYEMCFKTYLSLFIRLLALYFSVYIISKVSAMNLVDVIDGSYQTSALVAVFIIIGALIFAKDLPKILEGLGIKLEGGSFNLNPLRKIEKEALGGKLLKKPNDALAKFAKGGFGLGTLSKKVSSGLDAKRNGKGFMNGFNKHRGELGKYLDKKRAEYMPYSHEAAQKKREGQENLALREKYNKVGSQFLINGKMDKDAFLSKVGKNYADSYRRADKAKVEMFAAQAKVDAYKNLIHDRQLSQAQRESLAKELGIEGQTSDNALIGALNSYSGKAEKRYEVAKAKHDEVKKMNPNDAFIEDAFDYVEKTQTGAKFLSDAPKVGELTFGVNGGVSSTNSSSSSSGVSTPDVAPQMSNHSSPDMSQSDNSPDYDRIAEEERERARNIHEYEIEKLRNQIEELQEMLEEQLEIKNRTVSNYERVVDSLEEQKRNPIDTASREVINKQIEEYKEKIEHEKTEIENIKDETDRRKRYLEERINLLSNGV